MVNMEDHVFIVLSKRFLLDDTNIFENREI